MGRFNPRARMGRDVSLLTVMPSPLPVSIHAPAWGATQGEGGMPFDAKFQSTRPHGARRLIDVYGHIERFVSIHAPAWGATLQLDFGGIRLMFQSTRPHGARRWTAIQGRPSAQVSIHAPAWGATHGLPGATHDGNCFNPRARMGRDSSCTRCSEPCALFQSTRPHGARLRPGCTRCRFQWFQSTRPHGARRARGCQGVMWCAVSIHAPAWGATKDMGRYKRKKICFNPRARMGRDVGVGGQMTLMQRFQSTRPHGARRYIHINPPIHYSVSIHAPAWGATKSKSYCGACYNVSIHAPAWGATDIHLFFALV